MFADRFRSYWPRPAWTGDFFNGLLGVDKLFGSVYFEGKHIGTALYAGHADRWELSEAHGKFNQPLAAQALRALHKLAERIRLPDYRRRGR